MSRPRVQQPEDQSAKFDGRPGKFKYGDCDQLGKNSMKCLEENDYNRSAAACQPHFKVPKYTRTIVAHPHDSSAPHSA